MATQDTRGNQRMTIDAPQNPDDVPDEFGDVDPEDSVDESDEDTDDAE